MGKVQEVMQGDTASFLGFPRAHGRAGVRNGLLVLGINGLIAPAAHRIAAALPGSTCVATPYGRGQLGPDKAMHTAQLVGLGCHPNIGATLIVGVDRPSADGLGAAITARSGKPLAIITLDDVHEDALLLTERGIRLGGRLTRDLSEERRSMVPVSDLFIGIECGHSDATSGIISNPLVGAIADSLVDLGGTAVIGETLEWLGAEHVLAERAADAIVGAAVVAAVTRREQEVAALGVDLLYNNPGHENVRGGLSSIEEKSLGAIAKAGERPIRSVLDFAEPPSAPGLHVMDGPGFSPESLTGFAAAGAQIMLFTTGPGNSFCSRLAPTIKISGHPGTVRVLTEQIDFDASPLFRGEKAADAVAAELFDLMLAVASGTATWGEIFGEGDECFARFGGSF
ncbi:MULTISPECIES: UxaA family hydrolase [unclassified Chelatococcus]|uniref:UxaA family hydrolase n=1 Tax=unclassified Chelatococcus TaxID=2638111 RepID=UPI001BCEBEA5|nr:MULTISPECIES: UxaA family hydrolase [unclassified Chelatococcus]MBS7700983.1 UxaA family hydrolase [Chelatococcus sp. YT9]MBX3555516.1 UxaA family hydrolase [Chelatococcus sp.]